MSKITAAIKGVGAYVPDFVLTNEMLEKMVNTNDEWITERTGIKERRILKDPDKGVVYMGAKAVEDLQTRIDLDVTTIDLIIFATCTPDFSIPACASKLAFMIGAVNAGGYDVQAACSTYIYALSIATQAIESGRHKKVLVLAGDKMSSIVNYEDRSTCILFGDACTATLLEPSTNEQGIKNFIYKMDGSGFEKLYHLAGGTIAPVTKRVLEEKTQFVYQEGTTVFKAAVNAMSSIVGDIMEKNNLSKDDVNWLVPHQANNRIIQSVIKSTGIDESKVTVNIHKYGNTTCATIPLCLWEWSDKMKTGDNIVLAAFGGGFNWGSLYLTWS